MYNSTIIPKRKLLKCGHTDFNFSRGRCKQCATIEDTLIRMNEADEKEEGLGDLIKECDALFSKFIRNKYKGKDGLVGCYTCDTRDEIGKLQNGHYVGRSSMFLRFDERNCRPQCEYCNCHKHGNLLVFAKNLEAEHEGITEILYEESKIIYKYNRHELQQLKNDLTNKLKLLKQHTT